MTHNVLLLLSDKTEVLFVGSKHLRHSLAGDIGSQSGLAPASSTVVKDLGLSFDQDLSISTHMKQISRTAYFHLHSIAKISSVLSSEAAEKLIHTFVTSKLDYRNSLLLRCRKQSVRTLQLIQNSAARVLMKTKRRDHISPVLALVSNKI